MKTIALAILATYSFSFVHSQTTWNLAGNTLNGTQKLGSINNADYGPRIRHRVFGVSIGKYFKKKNITLDTHNKE